MKKIGVIVVAVLLTSGCSTQQLNRVGMGNAPVTNYPQYMTNSQLCEIQVYGRSTTQTRVAVAAEYSRRGLNGAYCERLYTKSTLAKWYERFIQGREDQPAQSRPLPEQYL